VAIDVTVEHALCPDPMNGGGLFGGLPTTFTFTNKPPQVRDKLVTLGFISLASRPEAALCIRQVYT
jgi:hypothetical protein